MSAEVPAPGETGNGLPRAGQSRATHAGAPETSATPGAGGAPAPLPPPGSSGSRRARSRLLQSWLQPAGVLGIVMIPITIAGILVGRSPPAQHSSPPTPIVPFVDAGSNNDDNEQHPNSGDGSLGDLYVQVQRELDSLPNPREVADRDEHIALRPRLRGVLNGFQKSTEFEAHEPSYVGSLLAGIARQAEVIPLNEWLRAQDDDVARKAWFHNAKLPSGSFSPRGKLEAVDLTGLTLEPPPTPDCGALLVNLSFQWSTLRRAIFSGASLENVCFDRTLLCNARFEKCSIEGCSFQYADLRGTTFAGARFSSSGSPQDESRAASHTLEMGPMFLGSLIIESDLKERLEARSEELSLLRGSVVDVALVVPSKRPNFSPSPNQIVIEQQLTSRSTKSNKAGHNLGDASTAATLTVRLVVHAPSGKLSPLLIREIKNKLLGGGAPHLWLDRYITEAMRELQDSP